MGDIEELGTSSVRVPPPKAQNDDDGISGVQSNVRSTVPRSGADVPGDATVYVHTFGCGHNVSDSEYMSGQLFSQGYRITDEFKAADCYLINSCTVKNPSEDHFVTLVRRAKATKKPVICAGCVPAGDPKGAEWQDVSVIGVRQINRIGEVVAEALRGNTVRLFDTPEQAAKSAGHRGAAGKGAASAASSATADSSNNNNNKKNPLPSLLLPKVRRNRFIEIIPINVGCLNTCTYCKTKHARGDLQSWPVEEIVQRVKDCVAEGVREIHLTSEDTGAYGIDLGTDIVQLMRAILVVLQPTDVMLRLGMTNPPYLLRHLDAIGPLFQHKNMFEFVHIPVQSGSDAVLEEMKREYTVAEFKRCVRSLQQHCPRMMLATDIICAFPNEGEKEWKETLDLCREIKFPILNISRFYPRRGTPAAAVKQIPTEVAKRRTQEISQFFNEQTSVVESADAAAAAPAAALLLPGTEHKMWVTDVAHDKHNLIGHTKQFVQVLLDPTEASLGDYVHVKLTDDVKRFCVKGKVMKLLQKGAAFAAAGAAAVREAAPLPPVAEDDGDDDDNNNGDCCGGTCCVDSKTQNEEKTSVVAESDSSSAQMMIVGAVCVTALLGAAAWWWLRHNRNSKK